ncbi:MAG: hypothetical protein ACTHMC_05325 [Pseudobacter sp.]|uniref:hypothetical protein n=1 Tax=Pseudobacter sp. TaxID=2045420 RepID=UPI003F800BB3
MSRKLWVLLLCVCTGYKALPQCAAPAVPATPCTGTPLSSSANITNGQTRYVGPAGGTYGSINFNNGGRLIICGNATIASMNWNGGTIIINAGASLTIIGNANMGNNHQIYNYGTITFTGNFTMGGTVYNAPGAIFNVDASSFTINSGTYVNNGTMNFRDVTVNSGGSMCMGPGAQLNAANFRNNPANFISVPSGNACVRFSGSLTGNARLSNSAGMTLCRQNGASSPASNVAGSTTVQYPCTSCLVVLPVTLSGFTVTRKNDQAELNWKTSSEENVKSFIIEQSTDTRNFVAVKEIRATGRAAAYISSIPLQGETFFRLKILDNDGSTGYSSIVRVQALHGGLELSLQSNPVRLSTAVIVVGADRQQQGTLIMMDNSGRVLRKKNLFVQKGDNKMELELDGLASGQYLLNFQGSTERSKTISLIRM